MPFGPLRRRSAGRPAVALLGGTLILLALIWFADPRRLFATLGRASWSWMAAGVLLNVLFLGLRGWRWRLLLRPVAPALGTPRATAVMALGWATNSVAPFKVGDLLRAYAVGTSGGPRFVEALASIVVERLLDVLALGAIVLVALAPTGPPGQAGALLLRIAAGVAVAALLAGGTAAAVRWPDGTARLIGQALFMLPRAVARRIRRLVSHALAGMAALRSPPLLVATGALSLALWTVQLFGMLSFYRAAAQPAPVFTLVLAMALFTISLSLSITPGSVGTYELFFVAIFSGFGLSDASHLAAVAVLSHAALTIVFLALGALGLLYLGASPRTLWKAGLEPAADSAAATD